ncbi:MAG TPA: L,D-transpeptidase [Jatrophihabitans sp.]|nr:L,D-transpeptidase [Jatrophihabitans sp.]
MCTLPVLALVAACTQARQPDAQGSSSRPVSNSSAPASSSSSTPSASASTSATSSKPAVPTRPVHVSLLESDGGVYGVGMPIIAWFNVAPTNAKAFDAATKVTQNGHVVPGSWYFERTAHPGAAMEGHWRPQHYWLGHSSIHVDLPVKGLSAGPGLAFDDSLTLDISTGTAIVSRVDAVSLHMTVTVDGKLYGTYPVSLGAPNTPTSRGIKVIMEKGADISMRGPGYYDPHVQWTQRLTYGGEYLHSAPWNVNNLGVRSTSNGCTNLAPATAKGLYNLMKIGDVVEYPNANGPAMTLGAGYGDWNVPWSQWLTGGAVSSS